MFVVLTNEAVGNITIAATKLTATPSTSHPHLPPKVGCSSCLLVGFFCHRSLPLPLIAFWSIGKASLSKKRIPSLTCADRYVENRTVTLFPDTSLLADVLLLYSDGNPWHPLLAGCCFVQATCFISSRQLVFAFEKCALYQARQPPSMALRCYRPVSYSVRYCSRGVRVFWC